MQPSSRRSGIRCVARDAPPGWFLAERGNLDVHCSVVLAVVALRATRHSRLTVRGLDPCAVGAIAQVVIHVSVPRPILLRGHRVIRGDSHSSPHLLSRLVTRVKLQGCACVAIGRYGRVSCASRGAFSTARGARGPTCPPPHLPNSCSCRASEAERQARSGTVDSDQATSSMASQRVTPQPS